MNKNTIKKIIFSVAILAILGFGNMAVASEVTGTLSTGVNQVGNTLTATVVDPSSGGSGGGGGGGGGGSSSESNEQAELTGDANEDGRTDILDFVYLMANWGDTGTDIKGDFNDDGNIDILDFVILMANWTI